MDSMNPPPAVPGSGVAATVATARDRVLASVNDVFDDLKERVGSAEDEARAEAERSGALARESARRELTEALNALVRQLKQADSREVWARTFLDATTGFCRRAALFGVRDSNLSLEGSRGIEGEQGFVVPLGSTPAFSGAIESGDTVVAAATARELSPEIASLLPPEPSARAYLLPIGTASGAAAVLFAIPDEDGAIDVSALELLAALAGAWLPGVSVAAEPVESKPVADLVTIAAPPQPASVAAKPSWPELSTSEREMHLKAQRYARTRVAEIVLRAGDRIRQGRAARDLYSTVKEEIDSGREAFRKQFVAPSSSMVDYFHLELARTLAKGDAALLGPDYPGPLH